MSIYRFVLLLFILFSNLAPAQFPVAAFWQQTNPFLRFLTLPQSLATYNCSGVMTVQASDSLGNPVNVVPDLTVNLTGTSGVTYYSDSVCTTPITDVTIASGTSSKNFYFVSETQGLVDVIASASGYDSAAQIETITPNPFIWIGAGANSNWSTAQNWLGGVAPGVANTAIFDGTCVSNCSPNITSNISVKGVKIFTPYSSTITQTAANTITVGTDGWWQEGGTFVGGTGAINLSTYFVVSGGSFTATTGLLNLASPRRITLANSTFTHNGGNAELSGGISSTNPGIFNTGNNSFNNMTLTFNSHARFSTVGSMKVDGNLSTNFNVPSTDLYFTSGTIELKGNLNLGGTTPRGLWGDGFVKLVGNPSGQTITGIANSRWSSIEIDAGVHPVTLSGTVAIHRSFIMTSVGTFTTTGSTLQFSVQYDVGGTTATMNPGNAEYNNVTLDSTHSGGRSYNLLSNFKIKGDLILAGNHSGHNILGNKLIVEGNVTMSNTTADNSTAVLEFAGTNNQVVTTNTLRGYRGAWVVNKPSGKVTLVNNLVLDGASQDLTIQSGTLDQNGYALTVSNSSGVDNVLTINSGATLIKGCATLTYETLVNNGTIDSGTNPPNISIADLSTTESSGGTKNFDFTVSLSAPYCAGSVTVKYATAGDTAISGTDFTAVAATTLTFAAGETTKTATVVVTGDTIPEINETFFVDLTLPTNGVITDAQAIGTIVDDDPGIAWTGATGNGLWNDTGNWSPNTVPTITTYAVFSNDNCSGANCNATINAAAAAKGVVLLAGYNGTITQSGTNTLTIGADGWAQASGTFVGGSGNITINNDSGSFYLTGGSFTSTSGTLEVRKDFVLSAAGTFLHNNGTLRHYTTTSSTMSRFKTDGHSLYHYIHSRDWVAHSALESDVTVLGNLTISNTHNQGGYWRNAFNIFVHGNISAGQYWNSGQTPNIAITLPTIHLVGTSNQTINGTAVYSGIQLTTYLPNLTINKPSGTAYLTGEFGIYHSLKRVSGTVDATAATLHWGSNGGPGGMGTRQFDSNGMSITNFFIRWKSVDTIVMNGDLTINSDLTIGGHFNMGTASGGNLRVKGNVLFTEPGSTLSTHIFNIPITFEGTGNQTIANTGSTNIRADITVNKPSGSVIQNSAIILDRASNDLTIQAGTWNQNGYALTVSNSSGVDNVLTIASGATLIKGCATLTYETLVNNGTLNDGTNPPTISIADASIAEGNTGSTNLNFTVSLSAPYCSGAVTMNYATADDSAIGGIDFTSIASTALSFAAGESSKTVTVALTGDTIPEINETFFVNLTSPTNATIADAQAIGTITNDDVGVAWTGATGNGQWNNTGNWSPNTVPTSSLYAVFDPGSCSGANCNVTINANATAKGVLIQPGFTGTITQSSTFTVTVGTDGWSQNAGTFVGGSGNFSNNGRFTLSGGSFTATTGTTNSGRGFIVSNSSTFTHNNGTVYIYMQDYTVPKAGEIIVPDNLNFNNLTIGSNGNGTYSSFGLIGKPIILGNFILNLASNGTTSGEITAQSNVTFQNNFAGSGTGFKINLTGSNNQSITGNSGTAASSSGNAFVINKPAGTVTFYDRVVLRGEFTHVAGTVNFDPASTIQVGLSTTMDAQNLVFNHLTTSSGTGGQTLTIVNQLVVDGTLTLNYTTGNKLTGGTLFARGNIIGTAVNGYSTTLLKISGSANQLITGPAINMNTEIDKSGGTATFTGDYYIGQTAGYNYNFLYTAGNVVFDVTSRMVFAHGAHTINSGALEFNNVSFAGTSASTYTTTGSIKVNGLLTKSSSGFFFGGTLEAYGNISSTTGCPISNGANPRTQLKIMGAANQTIDNTTGPCLPVEIAKTGGTATFSNNLRVAGDFLYTSGTAVFDSTSSVQFGESWNLAANNLNTGSLIFNDVEFLNRANFAITGTLKVARDVKFQLNQDYEYINGGTIEVGRNLNAQHVSSGGTTDITFNGSGDQTYSWTYGTVPGNWSINKPSGKVLLANNLALKAGATMVINSGNTLEMSGNNLTAPGGITNNGTLERGPTTCGTISGTVTGNAAICTP